MNNVKGIFFGKTDTAPAPVRDDWYRADNYPALMRAKLIEKKTEDVIGPIGYIRIFSFAAGNADLYN